MDRPIFKFIADPGHGWLEVPLALVYSLDIHKEISCFSYANKQFAYLEEDCDMDVFIDKARDSDIEFDILHIHEENTFVRNLPSFTH